MRENRMNSGGAWDGRGGRDSNYTKVAEKWRRDFTGWDHEAICRKLHITDYNKEEICIPYFGVPHRIDRKTGVITRMTAPDYRLEFDECMMIYNLFFYMKEGAENSGEWVNFRDVKSAGVFDRAFQNQVLVPFAKAFEGRLSDFKRIGEKLGFQLLSYGDAGFQAQVFPCLPVRVIFWDGDEEFPAKVTILYDKNITEFVHPESVVMVGSECMRCFLRELR